MNQSTFNAFLIVSTVAYIYLETIVIIDVPDRCPKAKFIQIIDLMAMVF